MNENLLANQAPAQNEREAIDRLLRILRLLRKECPWDRKQTFDSLRTLTVEEVFELSDAIVKKDYEDVKKEVGDVLLHLAFYSELGREQGRFDFTEVCNSLCEKLIRRHPHIFAEVEVKNEDDVKENWEAIKLKEGKKHSVLSGVPSSLPAMIKAYRIQDKARGVGFDWDNIGQVWEKVEEEKDEFLQEVKKWNALRESLPKEEQEAALTAEDAGKKGATAEQEAFLQQRRKTLGELGDVFFALINYARFLKLNPEDALEQTNRKFINRFSYMEEQTIQKGKSLHDMSLDEMNRYWEEAKKSDKI